MPVEFVDAVREQVKARIALVGPNGSGKTLGALTIANAIGETTVVIDSQKGQAKLYADRFSFKHANITDHLPEEFRDVARQAAQIAGPTGVVIVDSLSHEWLRLLVEADKFGDWKNLSPRHADALSAILDIDCHLIVTMRTKIKYSVTEEHIEGRSKPKQVIERVGTVPVQREGVEYEFDILAFMNTDYEATFTNRCDPLVGRTMKIDEECCAIIVKWLDEGDPPPEPPPFDPDKDLLQGAIRGQNAARSIAAALSRMVPHVELAMTLDQLAHDVYDVAGSKAIRGDKRIDWMRRLSNATARLGELAPGEFPPATDEQFVEAFSWAFSGREIELVLKPETVADGDDPWDEAALAAQEEAHAGADDAIEFGEDGAPAS